MKTISIRQPWAWAILHLGKNVENRTWKTNHRGQVLIHAGKTYDKQGHEFLVNTFGCVPPRDLPSGGIVGMVEITDCKEKVESQWFMDHGFGWVLNNPIEMPFVPYKGQLGFFDVDLDIFNEN